MRTDVLSGWGRYPEVACVVDEPWSPEELGAIQRRHESTIARGNGRSYGDASLNESAVVPTTRLDRLLRFDEADGTLVCEAGVLLDDLLATFLARGWIVPVTPGTRYVTVGGMIAADVHGKNHHRAGSFCDYVRWLDLVLPDGNTSRCSAESNPDLFAATCGGMGLTGTIARACFAMARVESAWIRQRVVRASTLATAFDVLDASLDATYAVAWIDCLRRGASFGRSVVFLGEHAGLDALRPAQRENPMARRRAARHRIPFDLPGAAMSRTAVGLFNAVYYATHRPRDEVVPLDDFFYPLDNILEWNRLYGRRGFVQYQCVLPGVAGRDGIRDLIDEISKAGRASFLAVLKRLGKESFGMLSFPTEGYTLALDFPVSAGTFALLDRLDRITARCGGRLYLAKDARASAAMMDGYPRLDEFRNVRRRHGLTGRVESSLSRRLELG
jgi:decaprenylphospho-beta-D-ribofuranose 2-oxidase